MLTREEGLSLPFFACSFGRFSISHEGSLHVFAHHMEIEMKTSSKVPLSSLSGLDLQTQGLSEGTTYLPLSMKLTLEFLIPLSLHIKGHDYVSNIISFRFDLDKTQSLKPILLQLRKKRPGLKMGLPVWAPWIPSYTPQRRKTIQMILLLWTIISIIWALCQLYQHIQLFRAVIQYTVNGIYTRFQPLWDALFFTFGISVDLLYALLQPLVEPLHVVIVTVSTPLYHLFTSLWTVSKSLYEVVIIPFTALWSTCSLLLGTFLAPFSTLFTTLMTPITSLVTTLWSISSTVVGSCSTLLGTLLTPVSTLLLNIGESCGTVWKTLIVPARALWLQFKVPFAVLWKMLSGPFMVLWNTIYKSFVSIFGNVFTAIRAPVHAVWKFVHTILSNASTFEYDAQKEKLAVIGRLASRKRSRSESNEINTLEVIGMNDVENMNDKVLHVPLGGDIVLDENEIPPLSSVIRRREHGANLNTPSE